MEIEEMDIYIMLDADGDWTVSKDLACLEENFQDEHRSELTKRILKIAVRAAKPTMTYLTVDESFSAEKLDSGKCCTV